MKKIALLREMPVGELEEKIVVARSELAKEKAHLASGTKAEKPAKARNLRRGIARMITLIKEKKEAASRNLSSKKLKGLTAKPLFGQALHKAKVDGEASFGQALHKAKVDGEASFGQALHKAKVGED